MNNKVIDQKRDSTITSLIIEGLIQFQCGEVKASERTARKIKNHMLIEPFIDHTEFEAFITNYLSKEEDYSRAMSYRDKIMSS